MDRANRVPLLFAGPSIAGAGQVVDHWAELVDLFPTLTDLAGLPVPGVCRTEQESQQATACTEGQSLKPVLYNTSNPGKKAAFGQW